jgi:hypothetical protein
MNSQSNLKLTRLKLIKIVRPDMFGLMSDMSELGRICLVWGRICPVKLDLTLWKSRLGAKMMNLGPGKLMVCKLNTKKLRENKGTTRNNLNTRNQT